MVYKCCAPGCKSGYSGNPSENVTLHKFPKREDVLSTWMRKIPRADFVPTKSSRLCSLHFVSTDFITESADPTRPKRKLVNRRLKEEAVPSIFLNLPSYFSDERPTGRPTTSASAQARHEKEQEKVEELISNMDEEDKICDLRSLREKFASSDTTTSGYTLVSWESLRLWHIHFCGLKWWHSYYLSLCQSLWWFIFFCVFIRRNVWCCWCGSYEW